MRLTKKKEPFSVEVLSSLSVFTINKIAPPRENLRENIPIDLRLLGPYLHCFQ